MSISVSMYPSDNHYLNSMRTGKKGLGTSSWESALSPFRPSTKTDTISKFKQHSIGASSVSSTLDPNNGSNNWSPKVQAAYESLGVDPKYFESDYAFLSKACETTALEFIEGMRKYVNYETTPIEEVRQVDMGNHQDYRSWLQNWTDKLQGWLESGDAIGSKKIAQGEVALNFLNDLIAEESTTPAMTDDDYDFLTDAIGNNPKTTMAAALDSTFLQHLGLDGEPEDIFNEIFSGTDGAGRLVENLYKARFDVGESDGQYVTNLQHRYPGHRTLGNLQCFNWETGEPLPPGNPALGCYFAERLGTPFKRDHTGSIDYFSRVDVDMVPATFPTNGMKRAETDKFIDNYSLKNEGNGLAQTLAKTMRDFFRDIYRIS